MMCQCCCGHVVPRMWDTQGGWGNIFYWTNVCCWTIKGEAGAMEDTTSPTLCVSCPGTNMPTATLQTITVPLTLFYKYIKTVIVTFL